MEIRVTIYSNTNGSIISDDSFLNLLYPVQSENFD